MNQTLHEIEDRLQPFFHSAAFGAARIDFLSGRFLEVNDTLCRLTGFSQDELLRMTLIGLTHPEDRDRTLELLELQRKSSPDFRQVEKRIIRKDGHIVWVHVAKHVVLDKQGDPEWYAAVIIDIDGVKRSAEQLAQQSEVLRLSQMAGKVGSYDWDIRTNEVVWSEGSERLFGIEPGSFGGTQEHWKRLVYDADLENVLARFEGALANKEQDWDAEYRVVLNDGSVRWIESKARIDYDAGGQPLRMFGISLDITERKRAEDALRQSETTARARADELAAILDAVPGMTFIATDPQCLHMIGSHAAYDLLGLPRGSNTSLSAHEHERPKNFRAMKDGREVPPEELPVQRAARTGEAVRDCELTLVFDDGTSRQILGNAVPLREPQGAVRGAVGCFVDITVRKRLEELTIKEEIQERLLQHEILAREEERRRFARELHDESGQMLASLLAGLRHIEDAKNMKAVKSNVTALRELTSQTIDELGRIARDLHPILLDDLGLSIALEHYIPLYSKLHGIKAQLSVIGLGPERLPSVLEHGLYRIAQESLTNVARHAHARSASVLIYVDKDGLTMTICDDGRGFSTPPDVKKDPSAGLGVSGMRARASMLGGTFAIESHAGLGTRVLVRIPAVKLSSLAKAASASA